VRRFGVDPPDRLEQWLQRRLGAWRLYGESYRLQAALFGTSTRNYLYTHKAVLWGGSASDASEMRFAENPPSSGRLSVSHRLAPPDQVLDEGALAQAEPWLWEVATSIRSRGKRAVFWRIVNDGRGAPAHWAGLNRVFRGSAVFVTVAVPPEMMIDRLHLSARGSAQLADVLHQLTRTEFPSTVAVH
jgi:hypothetical protein